MLSRTRSNKRSAIAGVGASAHATTRTPVSPPRRLDDRGSGSRSTPPVSGSLDRAREVRSHLRVPASPDRFEREHDTGGSAVERFQRHRFLPSVLVMGRPQGLRIERLVRCVHDLLDSSTDVPFVPRLVGEWLERLRPIEHR
jgi:hypothetical protein